MSAYNFKKIFITYFIIFAIAVVLISSLISYYIQTQDLEKDMQNKADQIAFIKVQTILEPTLQKLDAIALSLSKNQHLQRFINTPSSKNKAYLKDIFYAVAASNNHIMQLRLLDKKGLEKIRINRDQENKQPYFIQEQNLQNKGGRDYFQTIANLSKGTFWRSRWNLNKENGKIEFPYRPTIRIGVPLFKEGEFEAAIIVNILTNDLISSIKSSSVFDHYMIDKDGFYLLHPQEKHNWSRYTQSTQTIKSDFGYEDLDELQKQALKSNLYIYKLDDILQNDDDAVLVLEPKEEFLNEILTNKMQTSFIAAFLSVVISIILAFYLSRRPTKIQKELHLANQELSMFNEIIDKYVIITHTTKGRIITKVSTAFCNVSGYSKEELIGKKVSIIKHPDNPKELFVDLKRKIYKENGWIGEIKNRGKDGREYWLEQNIIPIRNKKGSIESFMSIGIDITAKKELEKISSTDMLTNIYNRRKIVQLLEKELQKAKRYDRPVSVILLDIDHFKHTNDTFGHKMGDLVLKKSAELVSEPIRKTNYFGRYGGEEFLIICPETNSHEALIVAQKVKEVIASYRFETVGYKTISLGVSQYGKGDTSDSLVHKADLALYYSKENGRDQANVYNEAMEE